PDVAEGCEARDSVAQVAVVSVGGHGGEAPAVVGVEEDEVGLDAERLEVADTLLEVLEEGGVEAGEVVFAGGVALEGIIDGLVDVISVAFGEDAHAHLIEWRGAQGGEGLLFEAVALMCPGIAGGADGDVGGAVLVGEVSG